MLFRSQTLGRRLKRAQQTLRRSPGASDRRAHLLTPTGERRRRRVETSRSPAGLSERTAAGLRERRQLGSMHRFQNQPQSWQGKRRLRVVVCAWIQVSHCRPGSIARVRALHHSIPKGRRRGYPTGRELRIRVALGYPGPVLNCAAWEVAAESCVGATVLVASPERGRAPAR